MNVISKFEQMPEDCLHLIFNYFTLKERVRLERVNKTFASVLDSKWRSIAILPPKSSINYSSEPDNETILKIVHRCPNLVSLELTIEEEQNLNGLYLSSFTKLTKLTLISENFPFRLNWLMNQIPSTLSCLTLEPSNPYNDYFFNQDPIVELALLESLPCLKEYGHYNISAEAIVYLLKNGIKKLSFWKISNPGKLNIYEILNSKDANLETLENQEYCSELDFLNHDKLTKFTKSMSDLKKIVLPVSSHSVSAIGQLSQLEEMELDIDFDPEGVWSVGPLFLINFQITELIAKLPKLKSIKLELFECHINDFAFKKIATNCPLLKSFTIIELAGKPYKHNNDKIFEYLAPITRLRHLNFNCYPLSNESIIKSLTMMKKITSFSINHCVSRFKCDDNLILAFIAYANAHPKRKIDAKLHCAESYAHSFIFPCLL